jgi:ribosomal protein S18 acetylase RimI-like enzyme
MKNISKLDNPIWSSLSETHKKYVVEYEGMKFYEPDYCPFGSFTDLKKTADGIEQYSTLADDFFIVGEKPLLSEKRKINRAVVCNQMILEKPISIAMTEEIVLLEAKHHDELYDLIMEVFPGYFRSKTVLLGDYYGIFKENKLIAVTGERLQNDDFIEISAVVTHPTFAKKGLAQQLVTHTANQIFEKNKTPYLHTAETNFPAINLYEKLGFYTRCKMVFWNFIR